ncbi:MAG: outer membrane lipoprotein-sorting protein [Sphingobacteriaceae bacterium]|nr:outer membrane lipoprotein-sorting protein [Sphingobacteriaceae bacterium]
MKPFTLLFSLLLVASSLYAQQPDPKDILRRMEDKSRGESAEMTMKMTVVRPRFTREMKMKSWSKGQQYSLVLLQEPVRDKGTVFLKRQKEIWNYVPSVDRMIKLPPSMMSQSWMGSDFSNDDLVRESSVINDYTHQILRSETKEGLDCWVIEMLPKPGSTVVYSKVVVWVSKADYYHLRTENYGDKGELVSTMIMSDIKKLGNRTLPSRMELTPMDKKGHKTIMVYEAAQFDASIAESFFSVQNLKNIR